MSIARYPTLQPRHGRGAGSVNDIYDAFEDVGQIDGPNLAEEGLDRQVIEGDAGSVFLFGVYLSARSGPLALSPVGTWTLLSPGGTNFRSATGAVIGADEVVVLRSFLTLPTELTGATDGISHNAKFTTKFFHDNGTGASVAIGHSRRQLASDNDVATYQGRHAIHRNFAWIRGPLTVNYFDIRYELSRYSVPIAFDPVLYIGPSLFVGHKYKRVS